MKSLSTIIQNKILLAILAGVISIGSFQVWQYKQQEYEKFIDDREKACKTDLSTGEVYVNTSRNLRLIRHKQPSKYIERPGINTVFKEKQIYVLMKTKPDYLIPPDVSYDSPFFKSLSMVHDPAPQALLVYGVSIDIAKKQAVVKSDCSKNSFTVSLENLYEAVQEQDFQDRVDSYSFPNLLN